MAGVDPKSLPVTQRINLLLKALNGAKRTNEALARCGDGEAMLDVLLEASAKLGLGLSRADLQNTPPIRDWIWWKNKEALLTIGDNTPRYQQDASRSRQGSAAADSRAENTSAVNSNAAKISAVKTNAANTAAGDPTSSAQLPRKRFLGLF